VKTGRTHRLANPDVRVIVGDVRVHALYCLEGDPEEARSPVLYDACRGWLLEKLAIMGVLTIGSSRVSSARRPLRDGDDRDRRDALTVRHVGVARLENHVRLAHT